ncbi:MAG: cyclic nucleotide-binding/CBS domain-containing protein [Corynebacterium humireducens]|jgi:CBS domain-containing protein|uniref:Cyclic nucleotide-binding/CBS domain-containing protein n=1 Tax=Corynebacterium humireducens TaxID=1223514 RepID=A0A7X6PMC0_9CORY|nr:cyclic nucleotide-binding/CBS domain-containing protein [Corynebacterium humireducens]
MTVELEEVRSFLADLEPFTRLPVAELDALPARMTMEYVRRGEDIIRLGATNDFLYIIRSGAVDVIDDEGILLDRRDDGRSFGYSTLLGEHTSRYTMTAVEDSLLLLLPREEFVALGERNPDIMRFYSSQSRRIRAAAEELRGDSSTDVLRTKLREFKIPNPVSIGPTATIREAAELMEEHKVSSLLITVGDQLEGIVTDRDLRGRVVAKGLDITLPITEIMTLRPRTVNSETLAFEAMLIMAEMRIHHLPIVDEGQLTGIVTTADVMRLLRHDPIYLTAEFSRRNSPEELKDAYSQASEVAVRFIERGASAEETSGIMTIAADSLARRLLKLGEEKFGAPPVPYTFVVLGSQGRREMGLASDQDNAMVLSDDYVEAEHGKYFADLAEYVCQGLHTAGQVLCPGDMMASNPEWRMTRTKWLDTFRLWVTAPEPDALLHAQTFFDFRGIHGDTELADDVHNNAVGMARGARRMHAHLAALAARREPPLGFFRGLVVDRSGEYANTLNVKKGGTAGIVQMARLFALASGVTALGTRNRLIEASATGAVSERGALDLVDAFDYLNSITLRHQATQLREKSVPDYNIDPNKLGKMDREHLRDSFQIIKSMQNALATKYLVRNI